MIIIGIRGLMGNPFSLGVDDIVKKIHDKKGGYSNTFGWGEYDTIYKFVVEGVRKGTLKEPVVIIGHSLGARTAVKLHNNLRSAGIKVLLTVCLDYVMPAFPFSLSPSTWYKVKSGTVYHFTSNDLRVAKLPGATVIPRYDLNHIELDNDERVHKEILELVDKYV